MDFFPLHGDQTLAEVDAHVADLEWLVGLGSRQTAQGDSDAGVQLLKPERFGEIVVGPGLQGAHFVSLFAHYREDDNRNVRPGPNLFNCREPAELGHGQIHQDDVRAPALDQAHPFEAIGGHLDLIAQHFKTTPDGRSNACLVVDEENAGSRRAHERTPAGGGARTGPWSGRPGEGRVKVKATPRRPTFSAQMWPWWASTIPRTIARPRPVPPGVVLRR